MRYLLILVLSFGLSACTPEATEEWRPFWEAVATAQAPQPVTELPEWDRPIDDVVDDEVSPEVETAVPQPECLVKGNVGKRGAKIYHVPGQANYERVIIDPLKGERIFCSEEEAVEAGWRKAQR